MTGQQLFEQYQPYPGTWDEMCHDSFIRTQYGQVYNDFTQFPIDVLLAERQNGGGTLHEPGHHFYCIQ